VRILERSREPDHVVAHPRAVVVVDLDRDPGSREACPVADDADQHRRRAPRIDARAHRAEIERTYVETGLDRARQLDQAEPGVSRKSPVADRDDGRAVQHGGDGERRPDVRPQQLGIGRADRLVAVAHQRDRTDELAPDQQRRDRANLRCISIETEHLSRLA